MRISRATTNRRSGFTLIEMLIVLAVLVIVSVAIMPSVVAYEKSQRAKALEASIIRLPLEARNEAARSLIPVRIRLDGNTLVEERVPIDPAVSQQPQLVKQLTLDDTVQVENAQTAGQSTTSSSWQWTAYPDGSADAGGIQFSVGSVEKSLIIPSTGSPQWTDGPLPDQSQQRWEAGQLAVR